MKRFFKISLIIFLLCAVLLGIYYLFHQPVKGDKEGRYFKNIFGVYSGGYFSSDAIGFPTYTSPVKLEIQHPRSFEIINAGGDEGNIKGLNVYKIGRDKEYVYVPHAQYFTKVEGSNPRQLSFKNGFFQDDKYLYDRETAIPLSTLTDSDSIKFPYYSLYKDKDGVYLNSLRKDKIDIADSNTFEAVIPVRVTKDLSGQETLIYYEDKNFEYAVYHNYIFTIGSVKPEAAKNFQFLGCDYFNFNGKIYHNTRLTDKTTMENDPKTNCTYK